MLCVVTYNHMALNISHHIPQVVTAVCGKVQKHGLRYITSYTTGSECCVCGKVQSHGLKYKHHIPQIVGAVCGKV